MTLEPKKPRRWRLQLHLSTAVILMFTAGGIIWANCVGDVTDYYFYADGSKDPIERSYGWPQPFLYENLLEWHWPYLVKRNSFNSMPTASYAIFDFIVALAILTVVWLICEGFIRYREGRRK